MIKAFIIAAQTVDGIIARDSNQPSTDWTSGADKKFFIERTKQAGVVVMGSRTYKTIGRPLPDRHNIIYSDINETFSGAETTQKTPAELLAELESRGFKEVAICGGSTIYTMFAKAGAVEKIYLTIEPKFFGRGLNLFNQQLDLNLKLLSTKQLSPDVLLLEYQVK